MTNIASGLPMATRILIAEDEVLVAMVMEEMLIECGYDIVGPVDTLNAAEQIIEAGQFDIALIDINLHGASGLPLAHMLLARGIPFAFATGHAQPGDKEFPNVAVLQKPFDFPALREIVEQLVSLLNTDPRSSGTL